MGWKQRTGGSWRSSIKVSLALLEAGASGVPPCVVPPPFTDPARRDGSDTSEASLCLPRPGGAGNEGHLPRGLLPPSKGEPGLFSSAAWLLTLPSLLALREMESDEQLSVRSCASHNIEVLQAGHEEEPSGSSLWSRLPRVFRACCSSAEGNSWLVTKALPERNGFWTYPGLMFRPARASRCHSPRSTP